VIVDANAGTVKYTPNANFNGTDTYTYTVTSGGKTETATVTVTVTVTAVNGTPVANADAVTTAEDTPVTINVLANDTDADGDTLSVTAASASNGTVTINTNGTLAYAPNANFNGSDTISYSISDGKGGTSTASVTVTVTAVNDAPVANADAATTAEDTSVTISVLGNDTDADGDTLSVTAASASNGTVTINTNGTLAYAPNANFSGSDTISYSISDGKGGTSTASVTVTVTAVNDAPVANADTATTTEDTPVTISVLGNDTDADGDTLSVSAASAGNGTVSINANGTLAYTPNPNFNGSDTINYSISDGKGGTASASVTVTVTPVNDLPVASSGSVTVDENSELNGTVPAATDSDGTVVSYTLVNGPTAGSLSFAANGSYSFVPGADFDDLAVGEQREVSFTYLAVDNEGGSSNPETITIIVTGVNDAPNAANDALVTEEDTELQIAFADLLGNDSDIDGDTLTISSFTQPANGTLVDNGAGGFSYTPNENYHGADSFTYTVSDGQGGTSTATVLLTVNQVNDAPVASADEAITDEDTPITITVLDNDSDADGDTLSVTAASAGNGTVTINADCSLAYTPNENFNGADTVTYTVSDGQGGTDTATVTVTVTPVNDAPVAGPDTATTNEDTPVTIAVLDNVTDVDGDTLSVTAASARNGTVTINPDGTVTYTPAENFFGTDTITYTISDGQGGTATETVTVTVTSVNDAPVAVADATVTDEDTPITITVLDNDSDADGDTLSVTAASAGNGTVTINADGSLAYTPNENFNGADTVTYSVSDGQGGTDTATVTVTVTAVNDAPVANPDATTIDEDTPVTIDVLANDTDVDGDTLSVVAGRADNGSVTINSDGSITYLPNANFNGSDTITYAVSDNSGGTTTVSFTITVLPVNDAASRTGTAQGSVTENVNVVAGNLSFTGTMAVTDVDGPAEAAFLTGSENVRSSPGTLGTLQITETGQWSYTVPNSQVLFLRQGDTKVETFTVRSVDGTEQVVTMTIRGVNEAPVIVDTPPAPVVTPPAPVRPPEPAAVATGLPTRGPVINSGISLGMATNGLSSFGGMNSDPAMRLAVNSADFASESVEIAIWQPLVIPAIEENLQVMRGMPDQILDASMMQLGRSFIVPGDAFAHSRPDAEVTLRAELVDGTVLPPWITLDAESGQFKFESPEDFRGEIRITLIARDKDGREATTVFRVRVVDEIDANAAAGRTGLIQQLVNAGQQESPLTAQWMAESAREASL